MVHGINTPPVHLEINDGVLVIFVAETIVADANSVGTVGVGGIMIGVSNFTMVPLRFRVGDH
jgi:hypothetical protein